MECIDQGVPVQPSKFEFIFFMLWLIEGTFVISQCCIKLAVLAILNRFIKDTANTRIRYAIYGAATLTATYSLAMIIVGFTACQPFYGFWRSLDRNWAAHHSVRCISKTTMMLVAGILAVVSDLYTIAIPWAISRSFGLSKRQTLALNTVFMVGLIVTAASCMRTYYLYCKIPCTKLTLPTNADFSQVYTWAITFPTMSYRPSSGRPWRFSWPSSAPAYLLCVWFTV